MVLIPTFGPMTTTRWYDGDQRLVRGLPHVGMRATTIWSLCDQIVVSVRLKLGMGTYFPAILVINLNPSPVTAGKCVAGYTDNLPYRRLRECTNLLAADVVDLNPPAILGNEEV